MPNLGLPELLVILVIVVLLFGVGKLPQLGKGLGEGIRNFKERDERRGDGAEKKDETTPEKPEKPK